MKKFYVYFKEGNEMTRLICADHSKEKLEDRLKGLPIIRMEEISEKVSQNKKKGINASNECI